MTSVEIGTNVVGLSSEKVIGLISAAELPKGVINAKLALATTTRLPPRIIDFVNLFFNLYPKYATVKTRYLFSCIKFTIIAH
jgi:hypothetical protein